RIALQQGRTQDARTHLLAALDLAEGRGPSEARVLNLLAGVHHAVGEHDSALDCLHSAVRLHRELGDRAGEAKGLTNVGSILVAQGEYVAALEYLVAAHELFRSAVNDERARGVTLINLGNLFLDLGQPGSAAEYFREALGVARGRRDRLMESVALLNLGTALGRTDDPGAEAALRLALDLA
ncbi:tetratricopeptide repeat protein, partial [Deinococcus pimensis]|uniref:tetratricopeptide repeat protein n=1 Tax=Deinococcus pimensis TaxID=309888 RepID=UPI000486592C